MTVALRILFTTGNAYLPQSFGGAQSTTDELFQHLVRAGHAPAVLCRLDGTAGRRMLASRMVKKLTLRGFTCDRALGYPVFRAWDICDPAEVVRRFRPDVAVIQHGRSVPMALALHRLGVPVIFYFHNVEESDLEGDPSSVPDARFMTNSRFSARWFNERFGIEPLVVPPFIDAGRYRVARTRGAVTFINPHPWKGVDIAVEVARECPEIPFLFVESWRLVEPMRQDLGRKLAGLDNVALMPPTRNMRSVYGRTWILLAPSQWHEPWGRVASEAHVSGIPVIGSRRGGLPEAIGAGGIVIDAEAPVEVWSAAVRRLWHDEAAYRRLSEAALAASARRELDPDWQVATYLALVRDLIGRRAGAGAARAGRTAASTQPR